MSLNPFPVTDLRPEVELMQLLRMRRHSCRVWNRRYWTDSEFAWTLSCFDIILNYFSDFTCNHGISNLINCEDKEQISRLLHESLTWCETAFTQCAPENADSHNSMITSKWPLSITHGFKVSSFIILCLSCLVLRVLILDIDYCFALYLNQRKCIVRDSCDSLVW